MISQPKLPRLRRSRIRKVKSSRLPTSPKKTRPQPTYYTVIPTHSKIGTPGKDKTSPIRRLVAHYRKGRLPNGQPKLSLSPQLPLAYWHNNQVGTWLDSLNLSQYKDAFANNEITGTVLSSSYFTPKLLLRFVAFATVAEVVRLFDALSTLRQSNGTLKPKMPTPTQ